MGTGYRARSEVRDTATAYRDTEAGYMSLCCSPGWVSPGVSQDTTDPGPDCGPQSSCVEKGCSSLKVWTVQCEVPGPVHCCQESLHIDLSFIIPRYDIE